MNGRVIIPAAAALLLFLAGTAYAEELVILETASGNITLEFFPNDAPGHVENFVNLTEAGFYDGTVFHRIIPGFMIQGGDPNTRPSEDMPRGTWGTGDPGYKIDAEFNDIKHKRGILSMARSTSPDSAGSQFFIVHGDSPFLDGAYTVFGRIATEESFETLDRIASLEAEGDITTEWEPAQIIRATTAERTDVDDLLELGPPERIEAAAIEPGTRADAGKPFVHDGFGISVQFPEGWLIQSPPGTQPEIPDIVATGPVEGILPPSFTLDISDADGRTLDEFVKEKREQLEPLLESGGLNILEESNSGSDSYMLDVLGHFAVDGTTIEIRYRAITLERSGSFYDFTYSHTEDRFPSHLEEFNTMVDTFEVLDAENDADDAAGSCLIATAAFGSELSVQVQHLREIRDNKLLNTASGAAFVSAFNNVYYSFSPAIADLERQNPVFRDATRIAITPLLATLHIMDHAETEMDVLLLGTAVILANAAIYLAAPATVILRVSKRA